MYVYLDNSILLNLAIWWIKCFAKKKFKKRYFAWGLVSSCKKKIRIHLIRPYGQIE
jgi:hypothetical protein